VLALGDRQHDRGGAGGTKIDAAGDCGEQVGVTSADRAVFEVDAGLAELTTRPGRVDVRISEDL